MTKPFVALYKVFRGGEWFEASLDSIVEDTDGAVVVFSRQAWVSEVGMGENCSEPLARFRLRHPDYRIETVVGDYASSSGQYDAGLEAISREFGPESGVMVIDTDEVWEPEHVLLLRLEVESHPEIHYFRAGLHSYVRSPLYRVWPPEPANVCVALQNANPQPTPNRFALSSRATRCLPDIAFHHFTYVRNTEHDLRTKFATTSSQEAISSDPTWWDRVWPYLPEGRNLHMTPGCESCWGEIIPIVPDMLPTAVRDHPFVDQIAAVEDARWRDRLRTVPPAGALIPIPTDDDALRYDRHLLSHMKHRLYDPNQLRCRMKTTYLEALWLAYWASQVKPGGRVLEIGCGDGGSTAVLATFSDPSVIIEAVDPFLAYDEETHAGVVRDVHEGNEAAFWETASHFGYRDRIRHWDVSSTELGWPEADVFDLVFVDGNHSAPFAKNDLELGWRQLKPGGIQIGHDYTTRFPGVIQEADAMESTCNFRTPAGTSLFYARKPEL